MVDVIRKILAQIENSGSDGNASDSALTDLLNRLASDQVVAATVVSGARSENLVHSPEQLGFELAEDIGGSHQISGSTAPSSAAAMSTAIPSPLTTLPTGERGKSERETALTTAADSSAVQDVSVRINVDLLDKLMTIAGEIVLARNQILQYSQRLDDPSFQNTCRQFSLITTELQENVMKTRLQPLANVWNRFPRLVHDLAQACGKKVRLEMEGSETELDKALLEAIRDPLTHLVRNAIDHGIEAPERRRAAGKAEEGCVRLRAYHEGGQVNVEIHDDGGGIDPERVKHRAIEQRLITVEQAERMSAPSVLGLIFRPGFSTAEKVTTVSGRGVGMDVVKTNVEKIGGAVDVRSTVGQGTAACIRIPLTLAIIKVLVVTTAGDRYAIPQVSIVELVRVEGEKARKGIQRVHGVLVYRYRNRLLPLVNLNHVLNVEAGEDHNDVVNIVVLQAADRQIGLVVDRINDTQEIVVKPLWRHLKSLACFAGATVMGDGKVALILDVFGLAQRVGAISDVQGWTETETAGAVASPIDRSSLLLVMGRDHGRMAIPLDKVARLEEFPRSRIERVAEQRVVQYRGQILPLLDVDMLLSPRPNQPVLAKAESTADAESVQVVVYAGEEEPVGLIVTRILDIVEQDRAVRGPSLRRGVECTAVIQGHVTEMIDMNALLQSPAPAALSRGGERGRGQGEA
jgi:two-component system chemotaxis sensor kinase CheA